MKNNIIINSKESMKEYIDYLEKTRLEKREHRREMFLKFSEAALCTLIGAGVSVTLMLAGLGLFTLL